MTAVLSRDSMPEAIELAYGAVGEVSFEGMHYRRDIGKEVLAKVQVG